MAKTKLLPYNMRLLINNLIEKREDLKNINIKDHIHVCSDTDNTELAKLVPTIIDNNETYIIKYTGVHANLIVSKKIDDKYYIFCFDGTTTNAATHPLEAIYSEIIHTQEHANYGANIAKNIYLCIYSEARQGDPNSCSIFTYKDLKIILSNPDILTTIINENADNLLEMSLRKCNPTINELTHLPAQFLKITQLGVTGILDGTDTRAYDIVSDKNETQLTLEQYILQQKTWTDNNGVYHITPVEIQNSKRTKIQNHKAQYFLNKYITDLTPNLMQQISEEEMPAIGETSHDIDC